MNPMLRTLARPILAELLGTFLLALTVGVVTLSISSYSGYEVLYAPLAIGGVVGLLVYCLGPVSGNHLNPAVSLGMLVIRRITPVTFAAYVVAQLIGSYLGFAFVKYMMGWAPVAPDATTSFAAIAEVLGAFILLFAITRVVLGKVPEAASGVVIGGALTLAITLSMYASGGVLNPAIAAGLRVTSIAYYIAPLVGAALGSLAAWGLETPEAKVS